MTNSPGSTSGRGGAARHGTARKISARIVKGGRVEAVESISCSGPQSGASERPGLDGPRCGAAAAAAAAKARRDTGLRAGRTR